jgi:hypothetical protein
MKGLADADGNPCPIAKAFQNDPYLGQDWSADKVFRYGDVTRVTGDNIAFVYVCTSTSPVIGAATKPPNTAYWFADQCPKTLAACKLRFDPNNVGEPLPFGAFPGTNNLPTI